MTVLATDFVGVQCPAPPRVLLDVESEVVDTTGFTRRSVDRIRRVVPPETPIGNIETGRPGCAPLPWMKEGTVT